MTIRGDIEAGVVRPPTLAWALKRALLGIFILALVVGGAAWLMYATIEPDELAASPAASTTR